MSVNPPVIDDSVPAKPSTLPRPVSVTWRLEVTADQLTVSRPPPPSIDPVSTAPSVNRKASVPGPPERLPTDVNKTFPRLPASTPVIFHVLALLLPQSVLLPAPPS